MYLSLIREYIDCGGENMNFSEKLQLIRMSKGMTQEELAEKLDISRQAVAKWESGVS